MFKKTKTFEQITSAFQKPLADLKAFIDAKDAENRKLGEHRARTIDAFRATVAAHDEQIKAIDDQREQLSTAADEAQAFHDRLEQFLKG